jgi:hypothetical protein
VQAHRWRIVARTDPYKKLYNVEQIQRTGICMLSYPTHNVRWNEQIMHLRDGLPIFNISMQLTRSKRIRDMKTPPKTSPRHVPRSFTKRPFAAIPPLTLVGLPIKSAHFTGGCCSKATLMTIVASNAWSHAQHRNCIWNKGAKIDRIEKLYLPTLTLSTEADFHRGRVRRKLQ